MVVQSCILINMKDIQYSELFQAALIASNSPLFTFLHNIIKTIVYIQAPQF